jgi:ABC-2 type transport system permease protein
MQPIAHALPASYVFEALRAIVLKQSFEPASLVIGAVVAVIYVIGAGWLFTRVHRHALRTGLIARYSAETIT